MMHLICFRLKSIFLSPVYYLGYALILACFFGFQFILHKSKLVFINYQAQFEVYTYLEIVLLMIVFCIAVYLLQQESNAEELCLYSKQKILLSNMVASYIALLFLCIIPSIYVVVGAITQKTEMMFTSNALIYVWIRWILLITAPFSFACLANYFHPHKTIYLLSLPVTVVFTYLNANIIRLFSFVGNDEFFVEKTSAFFSMQNPFVNSLIVEFAGARVDYFLICKLLYVLVALITTWTLIIGLFSKRKKKKVAFFLLLLILETGIIYKWFQFFPERYSSNEKIFVQTDNRDSNIIKSYRGDIKLGEKISVNCDVVVDTPKNKKMRVRLDKSFDIKEIKCEQSDISYNRDGDYIDIAFEKEISGDVMLNFIYSGRVYYISEIGVIDLYSAKTSAALPAMFAYIPIIDGDDSVKNYDFNVIAKNQLISNLEVSKIGNHQYALKGEAKTCSLFAGYFSEYEKKGVTVYRMKYNKLTNYDETYDFMSEIPYYDAFDKNEKEKESLPPIKKAFLISANYTVHNQPIYFGDYVLMNYGSIVERAGGEENA
ncbi:MAG: hypothetical protein Q4D65_08250 [Peptostreptococcaceae bacterium]|nr:hypothetical protein [Peptostreptococcaceae bacterium]